MSRRLSRRELAEYAISQLGSGATAKTLASKLAAALIENGRTKEADLLISDVLSELERRGKLARIEITSAHELSSQLSKALTNFAKKSVGVDEVLVESRVEPDVIGGFRLETANQVWDKTVRRRLDDIKGGINV